MKKIIVAGVAGVLAFSVQANEPVHALSAKAKPLPSIVINEVDCDGNDWIEIYNRTKKTVNLTGYKLTDRLPARATINHMYAFPRGTKLKAQSRLVVQQVGTGIRLPFGIPCAGGETLRLVKIQANGTYKIIDSIAIPSIANGFSYGRKTDGSTTWTRTKKTKSQKNRVG